MKMKVYCVAACEIWSKLYCWSVWKETGTICGHVCAQVHLLRQLQATSMFANLTAMNQNHNCLLQNNFPGIIDNGETGMT